MRKRTKHIDLRLSPEEKARIDNNAKDCGLSTSEYIRMLANRYEPKPLPPVPYHDLLRVLSNSYDLFLRRNDPVAASNIMKLVSFMINDISPEKGGNYGLHEDMACPR